MKYTTRAAFMMPGKTRWTWVKWTHNQPSSHAAIIQKAIELGAARWDFGQADHYEASRYPHGSR